jgi:hypothetical protein
MIAQKLAKEKAYLEGYYKQYLDELKVVYTTIYKLRGDKEIEKSGN